MVNNRLEPWKPPQVERSAEIKEVDVKVWDSFFQKPHDEGWARKLGFVAIIMQKMREEF